MHPSKGPLMVQALVEEEGPPGSPEEGASIQGKGQSPRAVLCLAREANRWREKNLSSPSCHQAIREPGRYGQRKREWIKFSSSTPQKTHTLHNAGPKPTTASFFIYLFIKKVPFSSRRRYLNRQGIPLCKFRFLACPTNFYPVSTKKQQQPFKPYWNMYLKIQIIFRFKYLNIYSPCIICFTRR